MCFERERKRIFLPLFLPFICPDFVPIASLNSIARDNIEIIREDYFHSIIPSSSVLLYTRHKFARYSGSISGLAQMSLYISS